MFEPTKKRRVSPDVAAIFPNAVTSQLFDILQVMNKAKQLVTNTIAVAFSDDYTETELYALLIQGDLAPAQEVTLDYPGEKPFLGHGYLLIVKDRPKTMTISFSKANHLALADDSKE